MMKLKRETLENKLRNPVDLGGAVIQSHFESAESV